MTKYHKLGGLKTTEIHCLTDWSLEVQNQEVSRAMVPLKPVEEDPSLHLLASGGCQRSLEFFLQPLLPLSHSRLLPVSLFSRGHLRILVIPRYQR